MFRLRWALIAIPVLSAFALAGCGGGGGGATPGTEVTTPPPVLGPTGRTLTGSIVSSSDNSGVPNIVVRLGDTDQVSKTNSSGVFVFTVNVDAAMPVFLSVDTSEQATKFPPGQVVGYRDEHFVPARVDLPLTVLNEETNDLGVITLFDHTSDAPPPPPYDSKNVVLVGRVVSAKSGTGVANVAVRLGSAPTFVATSGKNGYFGVDIGLNQSLLGIYTTTDIKFSVNSSGAGSAFPTTLAVRYREVLFVQDAGIGLPAEVVAGESSDLGAITLVDDGSAGGGTPGGGGGGSPDTPPPPPI